MKLKLEVRKTVIFMSIVLFVLICSGCTKSVTDYDVEVKFQEQNITGKYTGELVDDIANSENATFSYSDGDNYLNYTGSFKDGNFVGNGKLETNFYIVHFSDVDRTGEYKGDVVDGMPKGNGSFTATNDSNKTYTYTGEWDNGTFNGHGERVFEDNSIRKEIGTYVNGDFSPTMIEYLQYISQDIPDDENDVPCEITDKTVEFIANHSTIFPTTDFENIKTLVDSSVEFKHLMKNVEDYNQNLIRCDSSRVLAIRENNVFNQDITIVQISNDYGQNFYYIYYFGKLDNIFEDDNILVYGLPLGTTHFTNVSNTTTQGIVILGSYISKK